MSDKLTLIIGCLLLLVLLSFNGSMFNVLYSVWGDFWLFAFLNLLCIDIVLILLGSLILGIED